MKNKIFLILFLLLFLCSCATTKFVSYQSNYIIEKKDNIDIYKFKKPEKPYIEIGEIIYIPIWKWETKREAVIKEFIKKAKEIGADGIILEESTKTGNIQGIKEGEITAVAIKYQ